MTCVACVISIFLTVLVPLKLTYDTYKAKSADIKLWAIYWACFTLVTGLFWLAPFLSKYPSHHLARHSSTSSWPFSCGCTTKPSR